MIRTLVIDDDFQVARIHAASVEKIEGFVCIGQAHSAAEARAAITKHQPDLLILDIYLPDEDGLTLLRSLVSQGQPPDTIFITAARDVTTVRAAMGLGAVYYLVKPFGFAQLRDQLNAYRAWREQLSTGDTGPADQAAVDSLFNLLRPPPADPSGPSSLPPTMERILGVVRGAARPIGATTVSQAVGISRPTAQRYLSELLRRKMIILELTYGATGRPEHRYRIPDH